MEAGNAGRRSKIGSTSGPKFPSARERSKIRRGGIHPVLQLGVFWVGVDVDRGSFYKSVTELFLDG
jgi:hypothetical protein